jgi:hypothetical protein
MPASGGVNATGTGGAGAGGGGGGGGGGTAGAAQPQPQPGDAGGGGASGAGDSAVPIERGGKYALELGDLSFEVDPQAGGRVTRFALGGRDVLASAAVHADNWGSTFWPSPQSGWGWPPPPEIDSAPYAGRIDGDAIVLEGALAAAVGLRVTKRFRADVATRAVVMEFALHNEAAAPARWAAWQISRVPASGLTFFPTGLQTGVRTELAVQQIAGVTWYAHDFTAIGAVDGDKYIADGAEGWIAHANGGLLFVKRFADVPPAEQHASEGEIEIYANKVDSAARAYVEVECQGPLREIAAGGTLEWTVTWYLRELPADLAVAPGEALAEFARSILE